MVLFNAHAFHANRTPLGPLRPRRILPTGEMVHEGFHIGEVPGTDEQIAEIRAALAAEISDPSRKDLRGLLWSSIDNDTSRDLDQLEYAERAADGVGIRVLVAIADVSAAVVLGSPLDLAAADQTQTVYTAVHNFPMLPNELSTDLTSLNEDADRGAMVVEFTVDAKGMPTNTTSDLMPLTKSEIRRSWPTPWLGRFWKASRVRMGVRIRGWWRFQRLAISFGCRMRQRSGCISSGSRWALWTSGGLRPIRS